jgi:hypothetical protein
MKKLLLHDSAVRRASAIGANRQNPPKSPFTKGGLLISVLNLSPDRPSELPPFSKGGSEGGFHGPTG